MLMLGCFYQCLVCWFVWCFQDCTKKFSVEFQKIRKVTAWKYSKINTNIVPLSFVLCTDIHRSSVSKHKFFFLGGASSIGLWLVGHCHRPITFLGPTVEAVQLRWLGMVPHGWTGNGNASQRSTAWLDMAKRLWKSLIYIQAGSHSLGLWDKF